MMILSLLLLLILGCAHDSHRANPLDPTLTPSVQVAVDPDTIGGAALLTWSQYDGEADFAEYVVVRQQRGLSAVDTLFRAERVEQTSYRDTSLLAGQAYEYRVLVTNEAGFISASQIVTPPDLSLPAPEIGGVIIDATSASAHIVARPYVGTRFSHYELLRLEEGRAPVVVGTRTDRQDTVFTDNGLLGDVVYTYRLDVITPQQERVQSDPVDGRFHTFVRSWPLTMDPRRQRARLDLTGDDGLQITMGGTDARRRVGQVTWSNLSRFHFSRDGVERNDRVLLNLGTFFEPHASLSTLARPHGEELLLVAPRSDAQENAPDRAGVIRFDADGQVTRRRSALFASALATLADIDGMTRARATLRSDRSQLAFMDNLQITADGAVILRDEFSGTFEEIGIRGQPVGWDLDYTSSLLVYLDRLEAPESGILTMVSDGPGWQDVGVQADFSNFLSTPSGIGQGVGSVGLLLGDGAADEVQRIELSLDFVAGLVRLEHFEAGTAEPSMTAEEPFDWVANVDYRIGLEVVDGRPQAWIGTPISWLIDRQKASIWGELVRVGEREVAIVDDQPYALLEEGLVEEMPTLASSPSDVHVWPGPIGEQVGYVMPDLNQVWRGTSLRGEWPFRLGPWLGVGSQIGGSDAGQMLYPVAMAAGPDGRVYVVDAGNSRIDVFDEDGDYITHWGSRGDGPGQFNFGSGETLVHGGPDYFGSIAVDDEGFVYVVDAGNRRIQVFSP